MLLAHRLRRDRWQLVLWIGGTALLAYAAYSGVTGSFGTEQDRRSLLAAALANPVILMFRGLPSGADEAAFTLFLILPFLAMLAAFMSSFLAVRHTRAEEEDGRAELIAATGAGRLTPLIATIALGLLANFVLAVLAAAAFVACGFPLGGALIAGFAAGSVGVAFLGVGLLAGQIMTTARGANSLAVWALLITYLVAGLGNAVGTPSANLDRMESSWLVWLSPFGWAEQTRPFADDNPWPIVLCTAFGLALAGATVFLQSVRDFGAGFIAPRAGRRDAPASLSTPIGLVTRLTRGSIIGWTIGGLITGILATALASVLRNITDEIPSITQMLESMTAATDIDQGVVAVFFTLAGILAACCAVQVVCHARQEEARGTAEPVLSTPVSRVRWLADHLIVGGAAIVLVLAAAVAGAAIGLVSQGGDASLLADTVVIALGQLVAASVFLLLTALIFVLAPRLTIPLGWTLVVVALVVGLFGPLFGFPDAFIHLSPFASAPTVAGDAVDLRGFWWLLVVAVGGGAAALILMRRRELAPAG